MLGTTDPGVQQNASLTTWAATDQASWTATTRNLHAIKVEVQVKTLWLTLKKSCNCCRVAQHKRPIV